MLPGREEAYHSPEDAAEYRGSKRINDIIGMMSVEMYDQIHDDAVSGGRYLDIGAHDGVITAEVAKEFDFEPAHVYAIDVHVPKGARVDVSQYDGSSLTYASGFFSLVSFYQVLHHVRDLNLLKDVARCTRKGGYLIIREHNRPASNNVEGAAFDKLVELEHAIYDIIMVGQYESYAEFKREYYASCKSKYEWSRILKTHGYTFVSSKEVRFPVAGAGGGTAGSGTASAREPTRHYYAIYRKSKKFRDRLT
jgi:SAM-dependent methyltransferase